MKAAMIEHVDAERHTMFADSCEEVRAKLKVMLRQVEEIMANKADEVFVAISRDYRSVLGGSDAPQGEMMPRWQRSMRKEVKAVIGRAEKIFKRVAGIEVEDDEEEAAENTKENEEESLAAQDGGLSEGVKIADGAATTPTIGDRRDIKMEDIDTTSHSNAAPAPEDGADHSATEPEQATDTKDVKMSNTDEKKPRNASRPRDSGIEMSVSEHTSESSAESSPEPGHRLRKPSTPSEDDSVNSDSDFD